MSNSLPPSNPTERVNVAAPPKPRRMEVNANLSQLLNSQVLSDHFDHYGAPSTSISKPKYDNNHNQKHLRSAMPDREPIIEDPIEADVFSDAQSTPPEPEVTRRLASRPESDALRRQSGRAAQRSSRDDTELCRMEHDVRQRIQSHAKTQDDLALPSPAKLDAMKKKQQLEQSISKQVCYINCRCFSARSGVGHWYIWHFGYCTFRLIH